MEFNLKKREKTTVISNSNKSTVTLQTIITLNTALNDLDITKTKLSRAKNAELTAIEQEAIIRAGIEKATSTVSHISPATDPNYEESLRKAQEDLIKRSKTLEHTIDAKNKQQNEIKILEQTCIELERTIQTLNNTLGSDNKTYNPFFFEIASTLNKKELIQSNLTRAEAQLDPNEDATSASKKHAIINELQDNLQEEQKKLSTLEARMIAGEPLFSEPTIPKGTDRMTETISGTITNAIQDQTTFNLPPKPTLNILQIITQVPGLYVEYGYKAYFKKSITNIHSKFEYWKKAKSILNAFVGVAWMSILAPLDTIFLGTFKKLLNHSKTESHKSFTHWLNPFIILKALVGFVLGLLVALISLPFTTLGAVVAVITGIAVAFFGMLGIFVLEVLFILIMIPLCIIFSALKGIFLGIKSKLL